MAEHRRNGKLAVILHADIAGSTKLVQQDERLAHERIRDTFHRLSDNITQYHGQVRELRGDALLAEFDRASDAVTAALAFQVDQNDHNTQLHDVIRPTVRVGIAMGEVVIADETITGAGVVLAQRLEQLSEPGGVVIQGAAYETMPRRLPFSYRSLGDQELKGFDEPIRAYSVSLNAGKNVPPAEKLDTSTTEPVLTLPNKPSIAVLPFTNMSGDREQEYFSDGITEDIITELSRFGEVFVIARNSSFAFKGTSVGIAEIAQKLGVQFIIEGSVRKAGDRVRITAQLVDAEKGDHIWANRYDRNLEDIFAVQDEVCETVVGTVVGRLVQRGADRAKRKPIESLSAYDCLIRGREQLYRYGQEDTAEARKLFLQALALNPDYANAHAWLAQTYWADWWAGWVKDPDKCFEQFTESVERALALDDTDTQSHSEKGLLELFRRRYSEAEIHLKRAIELNPNEPDAYMYMSWPALFMGRPNEVLELITKAQRLDPFGRYGFVVGMARYLQSEYEAAIQALKPVRVLAPAVHAWKAASYAQLENYEEAQSELSAFFENTATGIRKAGGKQPVDWVAWFSKRFPFESSNDLDHVLDGLKKAGMN